MRYFAFLLPLDIVLTCWFATTDVLDGAMVVLAIYTLNFIHPGYFVYKPESARRDEEKA